MAKLCVCERVACESEEEEEKERTAPDRIQNKKTRTAHKDVGRNVGIPRAILRDTQVSPVAITTIPCETANKGGKPPPPLHVRARQCNDCDPRPTNHRPTRRCHCKYPSHS